MAEGKSPLPNHSGLIDLIDLIDLIATIQFPIHHGTCPGIVKRRRTPKSIVSLIVEMIEPYQKGAQASCLSLRGNRNPTAKMAVPLCGQDQWAWGTHLRRAQHARRERLRRRQPNQSNPTTWRLVAMNMAIRGIDFDFGKEPADTFTRDQHPDLRADFVMANPPFNIKEWWDGTLEGDARWKYGTPPQGNANFAWVQHMLHHLAPNGWEVAVLSA